MTSKERLEQYVKEDIIYNEYLDEHKSYVSDFDKFCIEHCEDIKNVLEENEKLKEQLKTKDAGFKATNEELCEYAKENEELKKQLENLKIQLKVKQGECNNLLREYEKSLEDYCRLDARNRTQQKEFVNFIEEEKDRLASECSKMYEDSLGKIQLVNEDIFNEVNKVLSKYKEITGGVEDD